MLGGVDRLANVIITVKSTIDLLANAKYANLNISTKTTLTALLINQNIRGNLVVAAKSVVAPLPTFWYGSPFILASKSTSLISAGTTGTFNMQVTTKVSASFTGTRQAQGTFNLINKSSMATLSSILAPGSVNFTTKSKINTSGVLTFSGECVIITGNIASFNSIGYITAELNTVIKTSVQLTHSLIKQSSVSSLYNIVCFFCG